MLDSPWRKASRTLTALLSLLYSQGNQGLHRVQCIVACVVKIPVRDSEISQDSLQLGGIHSFGTVLVYLSSIDNLQQALDVLFSLDTELLQITQVGGFIMEDQDHWSTLGGTGVGCILDAAEDDIRNIRFLDQGGGTILPLA